MLANVGRRYQEAASVAGHLYTIRACGSPTPHHAVPALERDRGSLQPFPSYGVLGHAVAEDSDLLDLANECLPGQPPPNILFAAAHAFLARHPHEPLARFYPS